MPVQDDERERELVSLFNLTVPDDRRRDETDAYLALDRSRTKVPFELKSTSKDSVGTVRDFGPEHVRKWHGMHWIFGFYKDQGRKLDYCIYASSRGMRPWIADRWEYVRPDWQLADAAPRRITEDDLVAILGEKDVYSLEDARRIHKRQKTVADYRAMMDLKGGYTRSRMLDILKERCRYVVARGATLNNPKIPKTFFEGRPTITSNHAAELRNRVEAALKQPPLPPLL